MNSEEWYHSGEFVSIKGLEIFTKTEGKGTNLVCIHGFPTSSWDFDPIWSQLITHFQVFATDLVGLGKSDKPSSEITVKLQADVIEEFLVSNDVHSAHILAHDLGDTVAQELIARQYEGTQNVEWLSCVFLNGGLFPETHRPRLIQKLLILPLGKWVAQLSSFSTFQKNMINLFGKGNPPTQPFLEESWELMIYKNGRNALPSVIRYMKERKAFRERWVTPMVENTVPFRLINGIQDPVSGQHAADRYKEVVPNYDVVLLATAGHYPHVETPEEVLKAFLEFHKIEVK